MEPELQSEYASDEPKAGFNIVELVLYGFARFYPWILFFALLGVLGGLVQSLRVPNLYGSQGSFMVRLGERETTSAEGTLLNKSGGRDAKPAMGDLVKILKNRVVFERLAKEIGPERLLRPFDPTRHDNERTPALTAWLHKLQQKHFFPQPTGSIDPTSPAVIERATKAAMRSGKIRASGPLSKTLTVAYNASDPKLAQEAATVLMRLMRERHREFFQGLAQEDFVTEQLAKANSEIDAIEAELTEHRKLCGFDNIREDKKKLLTQQRKLDEQLDEVQKLIDTIDLQVVEIDKELDALPDRVDREVPEVLGPNPLHEKLEKQAAVIRAEILKIETTFKPGTKPYQAIEKKQERLAELEAQLEETPKEIVVQEASVEEVPNPALAEFRKTKRDLLEKRREHEMALTVRATTVERDREQLALDLEALIKCEPYHAETMGALQDAKSLAKRLTAAEDKNKTFALLNATEEMSNLAVLTTPQYVPQKIKPERLKLLVQGLGIGLGIGAAFALLRQLLDPKLRYPNSVERALGVKVLGVIPEAKRWRRDGKRVRKLVG